MGNKTSHQYDQYYDTVQQHTLDPYRVLGVAPDFTWDELKAAFRKISAQVHPDKGGSAELFNAVTECFRTLGMELKAREADRPHHVRRQPAREYVQEQEHEKEQEKEQVERFQAGDTFTTKFNKVFDENKLEDEGNDFGYGSTMTKSMATREDFSKPASTAPKSFSNERFNRAFDETVSAPKQEVTVYREPEALPMSKRLQFTELGADKPGDYTKSEDADSRSLKYTDYMRAHTTERLVDPRSIKTRKEYRSVDDYEKDRERTLKKKPSKEETSYREQRELEEERAEEDRRRRLADHDARVARQYERVNTKFLQ